MDRITSCTKSSLGFLHMHSVLNGKQTTFRIIALLYKAFSLWWSDLRVHSETTSYRETDSSFPPFSFSIHTTHNLTHNPLLQDCYLSKHYKVISFKAEHLCGVKTSKGSLPFSMETTAYCTWDLSFCPPKGTFTYFSILRKKGFCCCEQKQHLST